MTDMSVVAAAEEAGHSHLKYGRTRRNSSASTPSKNMTHVMLIFSDRSSNKNTKINFFSKTNAPQW